jgi:hypothetical protein
MDEDAVARSARAWAPTYFHWRRSKVVFGATAQPASLLKGREDDKPVSTQTQFSMEGRPIVLETNFASLLPEWHTTIFPPYFVAGAIYSGFGMVLTLLIITRQTMHLERYITMRHLDKMAKVAMFTGMIELRIRNRILQRLVCR